MKHTYKTFCIVLLIFFVASLFSGCSSYDSYSTGNNSNNSNIESDSPFVIQNGHITDSENERRLTPCCLVYEKIGLILETEISNDVSNYIPVEEEITDENQYLVLHAQFVCAFQQVSNIYNSVFSAYADGEYCEMLDIEYDPVHLVPQEETEYYCYFIIPKNYSGLTIEYTVPKTDKTLDFLVQTDGTFTEEDISNIISNNPETVTNNITEQLVPITSATSDSFYLSSSSGTAYTVENTYDGNQNTCWQDGSDGDAIGESLHYYFSACQINKIKIINGNRRDSSSYYANNRLLSWKYF